jgi:hypothetical protein
MKARTHLDLVNLIEKSTRQSAILLAIPGNCLA